MGSSDPAVKAVMRLHTSSWSDTGAVELDGLEFPEPSFAAATGKTLKGKGLRRLGRRSPFTLERAELDTRGQERTLMCHPIVTQRIPAGRGGIHPTERRVHLSLHSGARRLIAGSVPAKKEVNIGRGVSHELGVKVVVFCHPVAICFQ